MRYFSWPKFMLAVELKMNPSGPSSCLALLRVRPQKKATKKPTADAGSARCGATSLTAICMRLNDSGCSRYSICWSVRPSQYFRIGIPPRALDVMAITSHLGSRSDAER